MHEVDPTQHPEAAGHVKDAQAAGQAQRRYGCKGRRERQRAEALKGTAPVKGKDRDEYPPASTAEGGAGASILGPLTHPIIGVRVLLGVTRSKISQMVQRLRLR